MPLSMHARVLRATAVVAALIMTPPVFAVDALQASGSHGLILSHLPAPGTSAYAKLKAAAGTSDVEELEMTGAEMWRVAPTHLDALKAAAHASGVEVIEIKPSSMNALVRMAPSAPMTAKQSAMMH